MTQYVVIDKSDNTIKYVCPYYGLINTVNGFSPTNHLVRIIPAKNFSLKSSNELQYKPIHKNKKWQDKVTRHFNDKFETRNYNDCILPVGYDTKQSFKCAKNYHEKHTQQALVRPWKYRRYKSHSTFSWRTLKTTNLQFNALYNSYSNCPKMRHPNRKLKQNWDWEHWNSGESTGWKQHKMRHQYMVHLR